MRTYDLSPLFRTSVGFDRLARMLDSVNGDQVPSYPPYNIEKLDEDNYRITMAVAGFAEDDLDIEVQENTLKIAGRISPDPVNDEDREDQSERTFLYRGIAERAFERRFNLADHIKVEGATLENGLLHVDLRREVPEEAKPRTIEITSTNANKSGQKKLGKAA